MAKKRKAAAAPAPAPAFELTEDGRRAAYQAIARAAVENDELPEMVHAMIAVGMSGGIQFGSNLEGDMTLLWWVLRKMGENRHKDGVEKDEGADNFGRDGWS